MSIIYIGSKGMGALALKAFIEHGAPLKAVVARWDDPSPNQWYPSVSEIALKHGIKLFKPTNINEPDFVNQITDLQPDWLFTAFYPKIYRRPLLEASRNGSINLHFAPLPRYRGSYPGAWAIINGEKEHGVTMHFMKPGVDNGDIIDQEMVDITFEDTGKSLYEKCERAGLELVKRQLANIIHNSLKSVPQAESRVLYNDRNFPYGGVISFTWSAQQIYNFVRALTFPPFANPFTFFKGRKLTIQKCVIGNANGVNTLPGTVLQTSPMLEVACGKGSINILEVLDNRGKSNTLNNLTFEYGITKGSILGR